MSLYSHLTYILGMDGVQSPSDITYISCIWSIEKWKLIPSEAYPQI